MHELLVRLQMKKNRQDQLQTQKRSIKFKDLLRLFAFLASQIAAERGEKAASTLIGDSVTGGHLVE